MASLRNPKNFYISLRSPHRPSAFYALQQAAGDRDDNVFSFRY